MVFHPQEFGNVATCCAYLEGAGLGPGAAVARSDGVAWRRVSINYSHNYNRRPAASPAFAIAIALSSELQCNCGWNARPNASKARGVSFHGIYQTSCRGSIGINDLETCSTILFFDLRGLKLIKPSDRLRGVTV